LEEHGKHTAYWKLNSARPPARMVVNLGQKQEVLGLGCPRILEFFHTEEREIYPKIGHLTGDEASQSPSCGFELSKTLFAAVDSQSGGK
jgi:hypothetical protein